MQLHNNSSEENLLSSIRVASSERTCNDARQQGSHRTKLLRMFPSKKDIINDQEQDSLFLSSIEQEVQNMHDIRNLERLSYHDGSAVTYNDDDDETSLSTTPSEIVEDLIFSIPSNIMFLLGSTLYTILSIMDWRFVIASRDADDDYYIDDGIVYFQLDTYTLILICAAFLMILNAALDFSQCVYTSKQKEQRGEMSSMCHRDIIFDVLSSLTFGIAAAIDFGTCFLNGDVQRIIFIASIASSHIYLLSAIFSLSNQSLCACYNKDDILIRAGDWLFLIGSLIDVVISYSDPYIKDDISTVVYLSSLIGSGLWLLDAVLYISVDFRLAFRHIFLPWKHKIIGEDNPVEEILASSLKA
mmetsp:Transcript_10209/g.11312  ORF Transcript_10209/g.11312 Transcript_10209/m.11312 type:complete len:357 (+) Transcript_10209:51-1121(+)